MITIHLNICILLMNSVNVDMRRSKSLDNRQALVPFEQSRALEGGKLITWVDC